MCAILFYFYKCYCLLTVRIKTCFHPSKFTMKFFRVPNLQPWFPASLLIFLYYRSFCLPLLAYFLFLKWKHIASQLHYWHTISYVSSSRHPVIKHYYNNNLQQLSMSIIHRRIEVKESWYNIRECKSKGCLVIAFSPILDDLGNICNLLLCLSYSI